MPTLSDVTDAPMCRAEHYVWVAIENVTGDHPGIKTRLGDLSWGSDHSKSALPDILDNLEDDLRWPVKPADIHPTDTIEILIRHARSLRTDLAAEPA